MSAKSSSPSRMSLQSSQTMSFAKTLHVQDQIIEQLRTDHAAMRESLEMERNALRECRLTSDRELKALQRENIQINKLAKQQEMKIEELEKALAYTKDALAAEQKNFKSLEKEHINTVKELKLKNSKECDKSNKQEMVIDQLKSEIEDLKESLESERNATNLLIREHNAEVKMLREEVRAKSTEAYRELKERAIRERDEYREMQEEAEKTYKILEKDFRDALAAKDEELRKVKTESRLIQKELEDQLRASLKEPTPHLSSSSLGNHDYISSEKVKRLKNEVAILREQNRKLLNELELLTEEDKMKDIKKEHYFLPFSFQLQTDDNKPINDSIKIDNKMEVIFNADKSSRTEVNQLLAEIRGKNRTILNLERELSAAKQTLEKVHRLHYEETERLKRRFCEIAAKRPKPKLPIKLAKTCETGSSTHVRDMVRRLQERHQVEQAPLVRPRKPSPEEGSQSSQTSEDLKEIDEDIEKLRKQIEERDKIISALREAAEAKDKKIDQLMTEYSKLQMERAFVNKNYHEPVYAQLLNDHTALQKIYNELRDKLEAKKEDGDVRKQETYENGINLIMAEQIRILKEREAQLMCEAEELREQNDLMEFRILELEECRKEEMINEHKHRNEKNIWPERDLEDISDSGVMSLPTSEDLTSDSELGDTIKNYLQTDSAIVPTLFPQIQICNDQSGGDFKSKKIIRNAECLQESGIFEDSEVTDSADSSTKHAKACQTESILDKAILEILDSSCDFILSKNKNYLANRQKPPKSDDLTTEISKLSEIQKRIQEKSSESPKSQQQQQQTCPHSNSVVFYEERLRQLEDKLKIYESSGDTKDVLLKKRLEKEIELSHRVKELTEKVASLEIINRQIEEERCEFEEAENDSRFQCQRLEVKVQELMEKNSELELEIERQKMMMAGDSNRRKKTKEKVANTDSNLSVVEAAMPAIIAWNMFCLNQTKEEISEHLQSEAFLLDEKDPVEYCKSIAYPDREVFQKLEELINDQKKLRVEYERAEEEAKQRELLLKRKIEELEGKSTRDREVLQEMTTYLKTLKGQDAASSCSDSAPSTVDFEMFEELKRLADNDVKMRRQIDNLERKEQAYLQTLQQADEIWAGMEAEYKKKLAEAEEKVKELERRGLDESSTKNADLIRKVDALTLENKHLKGKVNGLAEAELDVRVKALEDENASLKNMIKSLSEKLPLEKNKCETLIAELEIRMEQYVQDKLTIKQLGKDLEEKTKNMEKVETALHQQISELTDELAAKSKELSNLEVTVAELREEVETLENRVTELVLVQNTRLKSHGGSTSSVQAITDPRLNSSFGSTSSLCDVAADRPVMAIKKTNFQDLPDERTDGPESDALTTLLVSESVANQQTVVKSSYDASAIDVNLCVRSKSEMSLWTEHRVCELMFIPESKQPVTVILPREPPQGSLEVVVPALTPYPETVRLEPEPALEERILFGYVNQSVEAGGDVTEEARTDEGVDVSELSQTNLILQKTLEKIEEESRLKDLELLELQKTMSEMRKEQQELETRLLEQQERQILVNSKASEADVPAPTENSGQSDTDEDEEFEELEDAATGELVDVIEYRTEAAMEKRCLDFLQMIRPILIASAQKLTPSVSNLQVALDNLQSKCRMKTMLEEFQGKLDRRCCDTVLKRIIPELAPEAKYYEVGELNLYSGRKKELKLANPAETKPHRYPLICLPESSPESGDFSFHAPIVVARKIGSSGVFLEWDTREQPPCVTGFEIYVNAKLHHRVRSATRNQALLSGLDLGFQNTISLFPVSEKGRSRKCSSILFPEECEPKPRP